MPTVMKTKLKLLYLLPFFAFLMFTSCQDEVTEITDSTEQETIIPNSNLATLMRNTSTMDGSADNIIDHANCLSINLPVTVIVNGVEITIDSDEDYEVIEAIFDEFDDDNDDIEIIFPITIILSDFDVIEITNYNELFQFIEECSGENEEDDDIECIDFVYPITISVYDSNFQVIETITINTDEALYNFIEGLEGGILASINFPISMILSDGSTEEINNNDELETVINAAEDDCDEDDDNDYNDDDNNDIPENDFIDLLINCTWTVDKLEIDDQDLEEQYVGYVFNFNENGTVEVTSNGTTLSGTWSLVDTSAGIQMELQINDLPDFNNDNWILHEIDPNENDDDGLTLDFRNGEDRLRFEQFECDTNNATCGEVDVDAYLVECVWNIVNYNGTDGLIIYDLDFNSDGTLVITDTNTTMVINAAWSTSQTGTSVIVEFSNIAGPDIQAINGNWTILECRSDRLEMEMENDILVMEQDCSTNTGGSVEELENAVVLGEWIVASYIDSGANSTAEYADYVLNFDVNGTVSVTDGGASNFTGSWSALLDNDQVLRLLLDFGMNIPFDEFNDDWIVVSQTENRIELNDISGGNGTEDILVFEKL